MLTTTFTTTDLYLAAFLMARGHTVAVRKLPGGLSTGTRCQFVFPPTAANDADTFESGQAISAAGFADALKRLKAIMARAPLAMPPAESR
jgi:hypothetical protein